MRSTNASILTERECALGIRKSSGRHRVAVRNRLTRYLTVKQVSEVASHQDLMKNIKDWRICRGRTIVFFLNVGVQMESKSMRL